MSKGPVMLERSPTEAAATTSISVTTLYVMEITHRLQPSSRQYSLCHSLHPSPHRHQCIPDLLLRHLRKHPNYPIDLTSRHRRRPPL